MQAAPAYASDKEGIDALARSYGQLKAEIAKVIVGQDAVVSGVLMSLFANGHSLLVGVPGLAKTLLVSTISEALDLDFKRIQFTPDLMPSDITGMEILDEHRHFKFQKGPLFANIVLADEINRTPPKTQAALLEAMQERGVTVSGSRMALPGPFFVLATQNPIEQEGTYPLPEAQLDRFMFNIPLTYPTYEEEIQVVKNTTANRRVSGQPDCRRRADPSLPAARAQDPDRRQRPGVRRGAGRQNPPRHRDGHRASQSVHFVGGRPACQPVPHARGQGPRRHQRQVLPRSERTCKPWRPTCCGTGSCATSGPRPRA